MRRAAQWTLRAAGPALLAVLLWRVVDYSELRDVLGGIRVTWAVAALAMVQLVIVLRTYRWIAIHNAFGLPKATFGYQLRLSYATSIATLVLPQIVNPFSRLILLVQDGYRTGRAAAGAVLEKLVELISYVGFGVYGTIALATIFAGLIWWAVGLALASLAAGIGWYAARARLRQLAGAVIERLAGGSGPGGAERARLVEDIFSLELPVLAALLGWSFAIAIAQATMLYFLARSLGIDLSYQFIVAVWGVIALSMLLPISVNGLGTREAILVVAFDAAGKSTDAAVALGLLVLAAVAIGSTPGIVEWLHRAVAGGRQAASLENSSGDPLSAEPAPQVSTEGRLP